MNQNFKKALQFALKHEGGYSNDPGDPGGETKYGICKRDFPDLNIKSLTVEQAGEIYRKRYWDAADCDSLLYPLDVITFDAAVNCGAARSKEWSKNYSDPVDLLGRRSLYYLRVIKAQPKLKKFLKGWLNRISDLANDVL